MIYQLVSVVLQCSLNARAAVGMGIPVGIPIGMGVGWVWGLHGSVGIPWGFSNGFQITWKRVKDSAFFL